MHISERDELVQVRDLPLGGSALSLALQRQTTSESWLLHRPADMAAWRSHATAVQTSLRGHDWLTSLAPAFAATGAAAERLARASAGGVVVTTGQQPGLFGGPMYTWSKALSALAFADELEAALGIPVAPVFWAATDDADWHEAAVTHVVGHNGLETLTLSGPATDGVAMADVMLGDLRDLLDRLRDASGSAAHQEVLELVEAAYVPHATIGASYVQLLRGLLEPIGIAVLDASHPALRNAADPLLRRALSHAHAIDDGLRVRIESIRRAGFEPQVEAVSGLSLVFRTTQHASGRRRERVPIVEAARVAREAEQGTLGANVLLRPVLERALLPTVGYHAGPGEFAYFSQVAPIADALGVASPLPLPRWSGMILEPRIDRILTRLGLDEEMLADPYAAEGQLARASMDDGISDSLERLRVAFETQTRALAASITAADGLVPATVTDGLRRDISQRIDRVDRRIVAALKRREQSLMRDIALVRAGRRPHGKSPERVLTLLPMLARYGPELLSIMRTRAAEHARRLITGGVADGA